MSVAAPERIIEAVAIGPTWTKDPDWDGSDPSSKFILPEITLGWQAIKWVEDNLLGDDEKPFMLTFEQKRFLLWWWGIDEDGRFIYRKGVLQRLKGWGKDPLAAVIAAVEFVGPCRFSHWASPATETRAQLEDMEIEYGDPVARDHPQAWIQFAAVNQAQTRNTANLLPSLFSKECIRKHNINVGKEITYAYAGQRRIECVTSSPRALEGGRPTLVIKNETHHWLQNNEGHAMSAVIDRNLVKAKNGAARSLSITNAYEPSENSVAQIEREAYENETAGLSVETGVMYDSLEAAPDTKMTPGPGEDGSAPSDEQVREHLAAVIRGVRGGAWWLNVVGIVNAILDAANPVSQSRRFYFNQIVAAEDAWLDPACIELSINPTVRALRVEGMDPTRAGWSIILPGEPIVAFFDGSKSDDSTGLVGCRLSDGYVFVIGVWQKPSGEAGNGWTAPRAEIDARVTEMFTRFDVVAFWGDPSHARDDDASRYWDGLMDDWHRQFKDRLQLWSSKGLSSHSVSWDMTSPERTKQFVAAAELFVEEMEREGGGEQRFSPAFEHDGHPALVDHMRNARKFPTRDGVSLYKGPRGARSRKKIDLAVCAVGARMLRRRMLNAGLEEEKSETPSVGGVWG